MSISQLSAGSAEHAVPQGPRNSARELEKVAVNSDNVTPQVTQVAQDVVNVRSKAVNETSGAVAVQGKQNAQVLQFEADKLKAGDQDRQNAAEQQDKSVTQQALQQALDTTNELASMQTRKLEFSSSDDSGRMVVKVLDTENNEVIRQIPSEEFIRVSEKINSLTQELDSAQGFLFESKV